ncbi:hypothetical protein B296_00051565 [Ensete ventricosum]|uniref:Non-structural maintenance of chromosomes element 4 n=1 Tax=Ensete ventricosum TaxID=4639 RepID=A0A426YGB9_ENSVE|nr:hypothetical protein B296_00051565 [Ensete ventricosum]
MRARERSLALRNPRSVTVPSLPLLSFSLLLLPSLGFWIRTQSGISRNAGVLDPWRGLLRESETRGGTAAEVVVGEHGGSHDARRSRQGTAERRILRSRYIAVKNLIGGKGEDITSAYSERFNSIITEVESLHEHGKFADPPRRPREQVADAEALFDIVNTLLTSVRSQTSNGVTPSDFVTALLRNFGQQQAPRNAPTASAVASGEVSYSHFLMVESVAAGEEPMPHRTSAMDDVVD